MVGGRGMCVYVSKERKGGDSKNWVVLKKQDSSRDLSVTQL